MRIAIIGAMDEELQPLYPHIEQKNSLKLLCYKVTHGKLHNKVLFIAESGIGKVAASVCTMLLMENFDPDYVINIGSAGGLHHDFDIGDVVLAESLNYSDVDAVGFGYQFGQVPGMPVTYQSDKKLLEVAHRAAKNSKQYNTVIGNIISGDSFVSDPDLKQEILTRYPKALSIDMESTAVAQTCYLLHKPFLAIRSISDGASKNAETHHTKNLKQATETAVDVVNKILEIL